MHALVKRRERKLARIQIRIVGEAFSRAFRERVVERAKLGAEVLVRGREEVEDQDVLELEPLGLLKRQHQAVNFRLHALLFRGVTDEHHLFGAELDAPGRELLAKEQRQQIHVRQRRR